MSLTEKISTMKRREPQTTVRIPKALLTRLKQKAKSLRMPMTRLSEVLITEGLNKLDEETRK